MKSFLISVVYFIIFLTLLHGASGRETDARYARWKAAMIAMSDVPQYNQSLWPLIYEDRNDSTECVPQPNPEETDE